MQPVADLHFLQFAQVIVELGEGFVGGFVRADPAIEIEARRARKLDDALAQQFDPPRIDPGGLVIFVHQPFEIGERAVGFGAGERRGQVIDNHRRGAALGLRAFARVVDDERIDVRHRAERRFGEAPGGQAERLARQPFQVAVLAHVDDGIGAELFPHPRIEREIAVRRHQVGIVIGFFRVDIVAAGRLQPDGDIAAAEGRNGEGAAIGVARPVERIGLRRAPAIRHCIADRFRQSGKEHLVIGERQGFFDPARLHGRIGRPGQQAVDQRVAVRRQVFDAVFRPRHGAQQGHRAGRGIEPDAVADAPVAVGIVGEHQSDAPLGRGPAAQLRPGGGEIGDEGDAVGRRQVPDHRCLGRRVEPGLGLEGHGAGQHAAVYFRQGDVHGDVASDQPGIAGRPDVLRGGGEHGLQHRAAGHIERRCGAVRAGRGHGETGRVQDHVRRRIAERRRQDPGGDGFLQALQVDRQRIETAIPQRRNQRIHRFQVPRLDQRPVKGNRRDRRVRLPLRADVAEVRRIETRPVQPGGQQRHRFVPGGIPADQGCGIAQKTVGIGRPAMHQVLPQAMRGVGGQGRLPRQVGIRLVVAGNRGEGDPLAAADRGDPFDPVGPVADAAEHPQHHQFCMGHDGIDIQVDRHVMFELQEIPEAEARHPVAGPFPGRRQRRKLGIGGRQHDDVAGRLAEIDGFRPVGDDSRRCREKMHVSPAGRT